jgi:hypothetical protein
MNNVTDLEKVLKISTLANVDMHVACVIEQPLKLLLTTYKRYNKGLF